MKTKLALLILVFLIGGGCSCDCEDYPNYFDITGMNTEVTHLDTRLGNQEPGEYVLETSTTVDFDKTYIYLKPSVAFYGTRKNNMNFSFINSAYACSCSEEFPGRLGSVEQVSDIKVFSNSPFRNAGNPSELLNQYFEIGWGEKFSDIDAFLITKPTFANRSLKLRLKSRPDGASTHQFTIHYKQANGESYSTTTQEITFK